MPIQVNIRTKVNAAQIRREEFNGQKHIVIPSYTLPANVIMNGGLYPAAEIDANYHKLDGTFAPLGHPTANGKYISAASPAAMTNPNVNAGAFNMNTKKMGHRIYTEKWINEELANSTPAGRRLLERVAALENNVADTPPIHTSIAVYVDQQMVDGADGYTWIAKIHDIDHDAILLDEPGAATPADGVGMMVNSADATPLKTNSGALIGDSYNDKMQRLSSAVKERFETADDYAYVVDFTDTQAVIAVSGKPYEVFGYKIESGKVVFDDQGVPVERRESWVVKVNQQLSRFFNMFNNTPGNPAITGETEMPMTPEEKQEIATMAANSAAAAVAPIIDKLTQQVAAMAANSAAAAEAPMRAEVEKAHGAIIANSLQGDALKSVYDTVIAANAAKKATETPAAAATLAANSGGGATTPASGGTANPLANTMPD